MSLMKTSFRKSRLLAYTGIALFSVLLASCDSTTGVDSADSGSVGPEQNLEDFDYSALDNQPGQEREPGPSLGFALPPNGRIHARSGTVGFINGNEFEHACPNGKVLAGIKGKHSNRIHQLQGTCVTADNAGNWTDNPIDLTAEGSNTGQSFTRVCPSGHAVVGFTSDFENAYPSYMKVHCRKLNGARKTTGALMPLDAVGSLGNDKPSTRPQCADQAAATGLFGYAQSAIERMGLVCYEDPAFAGRWSSRIDWPHIAIHNVVLSDGKLLTYGTGGGGAQGAMDYNVWDPSQGITQSSHTNINGVSQVNSFCSAATLLPDSGNVLVAGGDQSPGGQNNTGIRDAVLFNASTQTVGRTSDMNYERWYPTTTTLPNGEILVSMGRDSNAVKTPIPEVYSGTSATWRKLNSASMSAYNYFYPRQFVIPNGNVFGVSSRDMYIMSTNGSGTITDHGDLPGHSFGTSATAAMYEPGKILHAGGISGHGIGAVVIDVTSGSPSVYQTENLAQPRRAWASTVLLADGKVLMVGGSYQLNDDKTQSLGAEAWDPTTETWTQYSSSELARLYHSTAVLLMDGRVLLAGGGSPGPLSNKNAEIFSPPYLFNENGSIAERPEITAAPEVAQWGQSVGIRTDDDSDVSRVTLVKTGSITHGFNMDQRFLDLNYSVATDSISVTMPASGNVAPPGYYMLFVHDSQGTPSLATMMNLGTTPAPDLPPLNPNPPQPPTSPNNLLANGGFEQGKQSWIDCAAPSATTTASIRMEGSNSMKVATGGCLYQTISVQPGAEYALSCHARGSAAEYSSLSLQMLNQNYAEMSANSAVVESADFEKLPVGLEAPANAYYASVTLYSEGTSYFDHCELVQDSAPSNPEPPVLIGTNLISNGDFEQGKTDWIDCSQSSLTSASSDAANGNGAMQVKDSGCIYQEFAATPGKTYQLSCLSKSAATNYSSLSLTLMSQNYTTLDSDHKPVGRDIFQNYQTSLFTPFEGRIGAVTLYSEDTAQFDDCSVVEL